MCLRWRCCVCGLCSCSLYYNRIGAAGVVAISVFVWGRGVCLQVDWVPPHASALEVLCVSGLCSCSLGSNGIGDAGAAAIGAGLVHVPQLQRLEYVVSSAVSVALVCACTGTQGHGMCLRWCCWCVRLVP
jgi:hypothetical protein